MCQRGEPDDEYVLEFSGQTDFPLEVLLDGDSGGFLREFVHVKAVNEHGFLDYSDELSQVLVQKGIAGCHPVRPVGP